MNILVLNAGSSSFKASLYSLTEENSRIDSVGPFWMVKVEWKSSELAVISAKISDDIEAEEERVGVDRFSAGEAPPTDVIGSIPVMRQVHLYDVMILNIKSKYRSHVQLNQSDSKRNQRTEQTFRSGGGDPV
jgi:hypothetical protein